MRVHRVDRGYAQARGPSGPCAMSFHLAIPRIPALGGSSQGGPRSFPPHKPFPLAAGAARPKQHPRALATLWSHSLRTAAWTFRSRPASGACLTPPVLAKAPPWR